MIHFVNKFVHKKRLLWLGVIAAASLLGMALLGTRPSAGGRIPNVRSGFRAEAGVKTASSTSRLPAGKTLFTNKVAVLMFHDIEPKSINNDIITPRQFEADLDFLTRKGMHFITLDEFRSYMKGAGVPDNAVLVTFDDGYESFYKSAYPILKKHGFGGVCFIITGDFSKSALVYTPHMTPAEISNMTASDPSMEVQAHTDSLHYKLDRLHDALTGYLTVNGVKETPEHYALRILNDTKLCIQKLAPLNRHPINSFAYPYGLHTPLVIKTLEKSGIRYAFTTKQGLASHSSDPMLLPRINAGSPAITPAALYRSIARAALIGNKSANPGEVRIQYGQSVHLRMVTPHHGQRPNGGLKLAASVRQQT